MFLLYVCTIKKSSCQAHRFLPGDRVIDEAGLQEGGICVMRSPLPQRGTLVF